MAPILSPRLNGTVTGTVTTTFDERAFVSDIFAVPLADLALRFHLPTGCVALGTVGFFFLCSLRCSAVLFDL